MEEERLGALLSGLLGGGLLIAALVLGANLLWPALLAVVLFGLARFPIRRMAAELEAAERAPADVVVRGRTLTLLQQFAPEVLTPIGGIIALAVWPVMGALLGVVMLGSAVIQIGRAAVLTRWQRRHGGRVLRTHAWGEADRLYVAH